METPRQLIVGIEDAESPEELRGKVAAKLAPSLSQQVAKAYAEQIVVQHAFDTPQELLEMTHNELNGLGIPMGHRKRAIFAGDDRVTASDASVVAAAPQGEAPPEVNGTLTAPAATYKWKLVWPDGRMAAHLRVCSIGAWQFGHTSLTRMKLSLSWCGVASRLPGQTCHSLTWMATSWMFTFRRACSVV